MHQRWHEAGAGERHSQAGLKRKKFSRRFKKKILKQVLKKQLSSRFKKQQKSSQAGLSITLENIFTALENFDP